MTVNYDQNKDTYQRRKKRDNEALNLEKFMIITGPIMEKVLEENQLKFEMENRGAAARKNAVECE